MSVPCTLNQVRQAITVLRAMQGNGLVFVEWGDQFRPIADVIQQLNAILSSARS